MRKEWAISLKLVGLSQDMRVNKIIDRIQVGLLKMELTEAIGILRTNLLFTKRKNKVYFRICKTNTLQIDLEMASQHQIHILIANCIQLRPKTDRTARTISKMTDTY